MRKIGMLGTGVVAKTLGDAFIALGHEVKMGSRTAANEQAQAWQKHAGARASIGTFADAAGFGELVVLATLGSANQSALAMAGPERLRGKIVIDTTNPLDLGAGPAALTLAITGKDSAGEQVQRQLPGAKVVKAFNTVGNTHMFKPAFIGGPPDMFICGDDAGAKREVAALLQDFGWGTADVGGIEASRYLEAMCVVWVRYGALTGTWNHAFKLLRS